MVDSQNEDSQWDEKRFQSRSQLHDYDVSHIDFSQQTKSPRAKAAKFDYLRRGSQPELYLSGNNLVLEQIVVLNK